MIEMKSRVITFLLLGNDVIYLDFCVFVNAYSIQKQIVQCDIKSKYPEENELLLRESCFV